MINIPHPQRVALLIDADNAQLSRTEHILKIADYYGQVEICRAYGDWKKPPLSSKRKKLTALKINLIQVNRIGKNATDNRLLIEIGEILGAEPYEYSMDVFIIVSSDGDFASACELIQQRGKQVIGIGNKEITSEDLRESCNEFYYIEDLEGEISNLEKHYPVHSEVRKFFTLLLFAYEQLTKKDDWVSYALLDKKLRELVPDFESKFGKYKLSEWLSYFDKVFESREQMIRAIDPVRETRMNLMIEAYNQTKGSDGLAHQGQLGKALRELDPDYDSRFGSKKLSEWLKAYPHIFKIHENHVIHRNHSHPPLM